MKNTTINFEDLTEPCATTRSVEINESAYKSILKEISPNTPTRRVNEVHVPQAILEFINEIPALCKKANMEITKLEKIQYGVKVSAKQGYRLAEVNVFYGKKGFSVVKSPKTGTEPLMNQLLHDTVYSTLFPANKTIDIPLSDYLTVN